MVVASVVPVPVVVESEESEEDVLQLPHVPLQQLKGGFIKIVFEICLIGSGYLIQNYKNHIFLSYFIFLLMK